MANDRLVEDSCLGLFRKFFVLWGTKLYLLIPVWSQERQALHGLWNDCRCLGMWSFSTRDIMHFSNMMWWQRHPWPLIPGCPPVTSVLDHLWMKHSKTDTHSVLWLVKNRSLSDRGATALLIATEQDWSVKPSCCVGSRECLGMDAPHCKLIAS